MKINKTLAYALFVSMTITGCEKTLQIDYKEHQSKVVIEGNITNHPGPYFVRITKSISLPDLGTYPTIDDAAISINDDKGNSERLTPMGNGFYQTHTLIGTPGNTYSLTIHAGNNTYTATSTMPPEIAFDSIRIERNMVMGEKEYTLIPVYQDPLSKGDNYRFILTLNKKRINQHFVQNDEIRNGVVNTNRLDINDDDFKLKENDSITVEMQCIDKQVALYYKTLELMGDSGPGGGTTPNNPPTNISGGALGLFSAHTTSIKSQRIK